jgi:hypothetical protein
MALYSDDHGKTWNSSAPTVKSDPPPRNRHAVLGIGIADFLDCDILGSDQNPGSTRTTK